MTRAENNQTVITAVLVASAVAETGVMCGSVILAVTGRDLSNEAHDKSMSAIRNGSWPLPIEMQSHEFSAASEAREKVEARQNERTPQGADAGDEAGAQTSGHRRTTRASDGEWSLDEDLQDDPGAATV